MVVGVSEKARDTYDVPKNRISLSRRLIFMGSGGSGAMCGVFGGERMKTVEVCNTVWIWCAKRCPV